MRKLLKPVSIIMCFIMLWSVPLVANAAEVGKERGPGKQQAGFAECPG